MHRFNPAHMFGIWKTKERDVRTLAYPTDDCTVVRKVRLAALTDVNLVRVEIDIVRKTHVC